ncbi:hypothetical protein CL630_03075 [bacterium]|nr:hypothetical protein [bacterium]|tara:strand:- start:21547 stop:22824 length:1278 start_codon:yes stop_codon:yes gene_type:complete
MNTALKVVAVFIFLFTVSIPSTHADWKTEATVIEHALKLVKERYLYDIDWTKCQDDILKELSGSSLSGDGDKKNESVCLDRHSEFLTPVELKKKLSHIRGYFVGIGIKIREDNGKVIITKVIDGTPAWYAGVQTGDKILNIRQAGETESYQITNIEIATEKLGGLVGSIVFMTIKRGEDIIGLPAIQRVRIKAKTQTVFFKELKDGIGYARVSEFLKGTADDLEIALRTFRAENLNPRVIIDLRGNLGGKLSEALKMLYYFSANPQDVMLVIKSRDGEDVRTIENPLGISTNSKTGEKVLSAEDRKSPGEFSDFKVAVLIDGYSVSASEIYAGTIKDWGISSGNFFVVGEKSFGKGVGQTLFKLADNSGLILTTFKFLVGNSRMSVQGFGISPNHVVKDTRNPNGPFSYDAQLEMARSLLRDSSE